MRFVFGKITALGLNGDVRDLKFVGAVLVNPRQNVVEQGKSQVGSTAREQGEAAGFQHGQVVRSTFQSLIEKWERAIDEIGAGPRLPLCLGLLRRYKGVELACDAVEALGGRVQLLIAGQPQRTFDVAGLAARAAASGGTIVAVPRSLSDAEFSDAVAASDAVLLPYHAVTGSGVLFAAWTQGAGVIASDLPFFREMLDGHPLRGRTFRAGDAADLASAISTYLALPANERHRAIAAVVDSLAPERVVRPFAEALRRRHPVPRARAARARN